MGTKLLSTAQLLEKFPQTHGKATHTIQYLFDGIRGTFIYEKRGIRTKNKPDQIADLPDFGFEALLAIITGSQLRIDQISNLSR